jgi:non-ribosomal peptide synthetase component E (peptide arylation enzyme)
MRDLEQEFAVVAMPDRILGERVCSFLVHRDGTSIAHDQLNQFVVNRAAGIDPGPRPSTHDDSIT